MPYPLPETIVNGVTAGHNAAHLDLHRDFNKRHEAVFHVGPPAAGTASGKDKAAALAAINAAKAAPLGGTVVFGAGSYDVGDLAILWPEFNVTGKALHLAGAGDKSTTVKFSVDRGLGTYAIAGDYAGGALRSDQSGLYENTISKMRIIGPGTRGAIGTSPCNMNGVMLDTHVRMYQVDISLFRSGTNCAGNHNKLTDCTLGNNYYGAYHTAVAGLGGDVVFDNCGLAGNLMASHAIAPNAVASFPMYGGHLGFNPYAIYFEGGRAAGSAAMTHCAFFATSIEYIGNGFLYSEDQNAFVTESRWIGCANFSSNNATYGLPASAHTTQIRLHSFTNCSFIETYMAGEPTLSYIDVTTAIQNVRFDFGKSMVDQSITRGVPLVLGPAAPTLNSLVLRDTDYEAVALPTASAITADRLIEANQFGRAQLHGTNGAGAKLPLVGVSRNAPAGADRTWVLVVRRGFQVNIDVDGAEPTGSQVLVPSSTTPSKVMAASWDGTTGTVSRPIVGQLYFAGVAGAGKTQANVRFP